MRSVHLLRVTINQIVKVIYLQPCTSEIQSELQNMHRFGCFIHKWACNNTNSIVDAEYFTIQINTMRL